MRYFIRVYTVCYDKNYLQGPHCLLRQKLSSEKEIQNTVLFGKFKFIISNLKEKYISTHRVNSPCIDLVIPELFTEARNTESMN